MWGDISHCLTIQQEVPGAGLDSLWDAGTGGGITSLIRDLKLSEGKAAPYPSVVVAAAPPSKRQCRSLSCSDEPPGSRSAWKPQGSRVWMTVEKRRCHSGGSVQRGASQPGGAFPAMQRSSSFSLPTRANGLPELPSFSFTSMPSPSSSLAEPPHVLYLSQEQVGPPGGQEASPATSPDSTPELGRRMGAGGLARSHSQPCALNERKIGMKRRRLEEVREQRPSLDLAKMTQKLSTFCSLSCPGFTETSCCSPAPPCSNGTKQPIGCDSQGVEPWHMVTRHEDPSGKEPGGYSAGGDAGGCWLGPCSSGTDAERLGGELDIEQIERN
ncbi:protein FAM53B isoform X2 [Brienomyrus brachyistius]|nr:protein FAM53B isoform X2 [Brienomyrus brachyistius]